MKSIVTTIRGWIVKQFSCEHEWTDPKVVDDYDLRSGLRHKSIVKRCRHCQRYRTFTEVAQ